jgi:hypothetical protein
MKNKKINVTAKPEDWQSFLALEPLDEDLLRIRDDGKTCDPFRDWNAEEQQTNNDSSSVAG